MNRTNTANERTALHLAAANGQKDVCRLLLMEKATVNLQDLTLGWFIKVSDPQGGSYLKLDVVRGVLLQSRFGRHQRLLCETFKLQTSNKVIQLEGSTVLRCIFLMVHRLEPAH